MSISSGGPFLRGGIQELYNRCPRLIRHLHRFKYHGRVLGAFAGQAWMAEYITDSGQMGVVTDKEMSIQTGTDALEVILSQLLINPDVNVHILRPSGYGYSARSDT